MIACLQYRPYHEGRTAQDHAGAHAIETDLIVPGQIPQQTRQRRHRYGPYALEHAHQAVAGANTIRPKDICQQHGHQHIPAAQA